MNENNEIITMEDEKVASMLQKMKKKLQMAQRVSGELPPAA